MYCTVFFHKWIINSYKLNLLELFWIVGLHLTHQPKKFDLSLIWTGYSRRVNVKLDKAFNPINSSTVMKSKEAICPVFNYLQAQNQLKI